MYVMEEGRLYKSVSHWGLIEIQPPNSSWPQFMAVVERHEPHGNPDYNRGFRDCKASVLLSGQHIFEGE